MSDSKTPSIGFPGLLALIFITLKLTGVIDWSWLWVLSPLWIGLVLFLGSLLLVGGITLAIVAITGAWGFFFKGKK